MNATHFGFRALDSSGFRSSVFGFTSADSSGWFCCVLPIAPDSSDYISFKTGPTGTYPQSSAAIRTENDFSEPPLHSRITDSPIRRFDDLTFGSAFAIRYPDLNPSPWGEGWVRGNLPFPVLQPSTLLSRQSQATAGQPLTLLPSL